MRLFWIIWSSVVVIAQSRGIFVSFNRHGLWRKFQESFSVDGQRADASSTILQSKIVARNPKILLAIIEIAVSVKLRFFGLQHLYYRNGGPRAQGGTVGYVKVSNT